MSHPISTERKAETAELAVYKCWGWVQICLIKGFVEGRAFKYVVKRYCRDSVSKIQSEVFFLHISAYKTHIEYDTHKTIDTCMYM